MKHKAMSSDTVGFIFIIAVFLLVILRGFVIRAVASTEAAEIVYRYTLAMKDREIQLLKDGFEKTAALYSLMDTAKELGAHGGLSKKALEKNDIPGYVKGINPPLRFEVQGNERIPYWVVPSEDEKECGTTKQRVPYLRVTDMGRNIGLKPLGDGKAESEMDVLANVGGKYDSYFKEVNAGKYSLYVALQIFFIKPGTVTVECGDGCVEITELDGTTPLKSITSDEIHEYKITKVSDSVAVLKLKMAAVQGEKGDGTNVARLKQVVVSIYDKDIDAKGNELFSENLDKFRANMVKALEASSAGKLSATTMSALEGAFYRGYDNTVAGIVWSPEGIVSETQDYLGNDKLLTLRSSGVTEEEAKIRYWTMYDYAEKFARCADGVLKYWLFKALNSLEDYSSPSKDACGVEYSCNLCGSDTTPTHTRDVVYNKVSSELDALSTEYTANSALSTPGISWKFTLPDEFFKGNCNPSQPGKKININKNPCDSESCAGLGENLEHYKYMRATYYLSGCCDTSPCSGCWTKRNTCSMQYGHRYILKNIRVLVSITDSTNKVFDPTGSPSKWVPLQFRFFVDVPLVDDNDCDGQKCDDLKASYATQYPAVAPALQASSGCTTSAAGPMSVSPISVSFASPAPATIFANGTTVPFSVSITSTNPVSRVEYYFNSATLVHTSTYISHGTNFWNWDVDIGEHPEFVGPVTVDAIAYDSDSNYAMATTNIVVGVPQPSLLISVSDTSLAAGDTAEVILRAEAFDDEGTVALNMNIPAGLVKISGDDTWTGTLNTASKEIMTTIRADTAGTYEITGALFDADGNALNEKKSLPITVS